ncbi:MAG: hypothetical protein ACOYNY_27495 [Caldilineaceae bacterium]
MLRRYIEYNYRQEIEEALHEEAIKDWRQEYKRLRGNMNNLIGHIGEGYLYAVLSAFDGRTVEGQPYFTSAGRCFCSILSKLNGAPACSKPAV